MNIRQTARSGRRSAAGRSPAAGELGELSVRANGRRRRARDTCRPQRRDLHFRWQCGRSESRSAGAAFPSLGPGAERRPGPSSRRTIRCAWRCAGSRRSSACALPHGHGSCVTLARPRRCRSLWLPAGPPSLARCGDRQAGRPKDLKNPGTGVVFSGDGRTHIFKGECYG